KALEFKPDKDEAWNNRGIALRNLGRLEEAIASYDKALEFKPDKDTAWYNRGNALRNLGRYEDAIASYDKALEFKPDKDEAFYNKACCYALQGNIEQAIENLQVAINLNPEECGEWAKTDSAFDSIREDKRFQVLIQKGSIPFLHVRSEGNEVEGSDRKISH
ncbi:tetratricopeptide repeat protein, partial [Plectonema radiosum NIES-515]